MAKKKIETETWYSLLELVDVGAFPWIGKDVRVYKQAIVKDLKGKNHLKTIVSGTGKGTRYRFKGENVIKFIKLVESGRA